MSSRKMQQLVVRIDQRNGTTNMGSRLTASNELSRPSVLDLFSGAGGISEGFRQAGFRIIAGSDVDPDAGATFKRNFPEATFIPGDIRHAQTYERIIYFAKQATMIVGGPPCQAFSQMRNHDRLIDDPRNSLYREFVRVIDDAKPLAFLMENVTGIDQMRVREQIQQDLALGGRYRVKSQILDAANFGVPQTRLRLFFVGILDDLGVLPPKLLGSGATNAATLVRIAGSNGAKYSIEIKGTEDAKRLAEKLKDSHCLDVVNVSNALSDLECLTVGRRKDTLAYTDIPPPQSAYQRAMRSGAGAILANVQVPRMRDDTARRLAWLPPGGNYRDLSEELLARYLSEERWGQDNGSGRLSRKHFYAYRKLHPDIWAWTLNTKADSAYHYGQARALSVREFARLQSFPDRFVFTTDPRTGPIDGRHDGGAAHSRYRQVGNAVPPLLAFAVAQKLAEIVEFATIPMPQKISPQAIG